MLREDEFLLAAVKSWQVASNQLDIVVVAPYVIRFDDQEYIFAAHLPHFGGPKGAVVGIMPPLEKVDEREIERVKEFSKVAVHFGFFYSRAGSGLYAHYDADTFKKVLLDWGYFGTKDLRPAWLS
ncbi:MAG TPA: hypothetical protein VHH73_06575 [Verrucomicrobiae bacterium]|nr:hypothetical protein [Verrucomicrobiae bacterium]